MRLLDTCLRLIGGAVLLAGVALSSVVVGSVQAARVSSTGGGASTLDQAFDGGKTIDGANSEANAFVLSDGTRSTKEWCDATNGCIKKPSPLADSLWRVWTNMNAYIWDEESNSAFATINPDAFATGSGTMTFATGHQVVASNYGVEFTESNTNPTCAGGNYTIYADTSEAKLKKCQDGTVSDLASLTSEGVVRKAADESLNTSTTMQDDDELLVALAANSNYIVHGMITYDSAATGDIKMQFTVPAGASGRRFALYSATAATSCLSSAQNSYGSPVATAITGIGAPAAGTPCDLMIDLYVSTGGTSGNLQLQWAQDTSDATNTTVKAGSFLQWRKL